MEPLPTKSAFSDPKELAKLYSPSHLAAFQQFEVYLGRREKSWQKRIQADGWPQWYAKEYVVLKYKNKGDKFKIWDLGGRANLRKIWESYYP